MVTKNEQLAAAKTSAYIAALHWDESTIVETITETESSRELFTARLDGYREALKEVRIRNEQRAAS